MYLTAKGKKLRFQYTTSRKVFHNTIFKTIENFYYFQTLFVEADNFLNKIRDAITNISFRNAFYIKNEVIVFI